MSTEIITIIVTIISANIALAGLGLGLVTWVRQDMKEQGRELRNMITEQGQKHSKEIAEQSKEIAERGKEIEAVKKEIGEVKIEVASLKATVETYFRVRVDPPQSAAVAEPPEDYGAD